MRYAFLTALLAFAAPSEGLGASPRELVMEGNRFLASGDVDGAISRFGEAQSLRPNSPEVDLDLGLAYYRKGEHDRAAGYFASAAAEGEDRLSSVARFNLGNARVRQGRLEDALAAYRKALEADPGNEDARFNYELVERHLAELKKREEQRKKAEEEFKKRLEELLREVRDLVERQAEALAQTWEADPSSEGPQLREEDVDELKALGEQKKPVPDDLGSRLARGLVRSRKLSVEAVAEEALARIEREIALRARKAAKTASMLARALRPVPGGRSPGAQQTPRQQGSAQGQPGAEAPEENPLAGGLERAGEALEEGAKYAVKAAEVLEEADGRAFARAEPHEATCLWKLVQALGALAQPPGQGQGSVPEELKEALKRMQELRARQALMVLDLWASFPDARGEIPGPEDQKTFWQGIRKGETPDEDTRVPMARLEIVSSGGGGEAHSPNELAEKQSALAEDALELATELEAIVAKAGGQSPVGALVGMLRSAAESMDGAAGALEAAPAGGLDGAKTAEPAAVRAFVRLSRAPNEMDALLAELGELLAEETALLMDTWKSDAASRGDMATAEELDAAKEEIERAYKGEGELAPEIEAKLGRMMVAAIERAAKGKAGQVRTGEEAARLQGGLAERAEGLAEDMKGLATSGRRGEMNPAAPMLEAAAEAVGYAGERMKVAGVSLTSSFREAEPDEARAVAALMRALSMFAQGAAGSAGEQDRQERQQGEQKQQEEKEGEEKEGERKQLEPAEAQEEKESDEDDEERESVSKQQAERRLDEAAQQERDVRRDINRRRGSRAVEVRRDW